MRKLKKYLCAVISLAMVFLLFGCGRDASEADSYFLKGSEEKVDVVLDGDDTSLYFDSTPRKDLTVISSTDMSSLCFSDKSCSVSVFDKSGARLWRSVPIEYIDSEAAVICLELLIDGKEYTLNSQRDSLAMDCASYEIKDDGVVVTYGFRRTFSDGTKVDIDVPVEYKTADGAVSVSVDCGSVTDKSKGSGTVIRKITLLPYLGANRDENEGDFILIPDGSGLTLDISAKAETEEIFTVGGYSPDPSLNENSDDKAYSILPVFGMKNGKGAFVAVIDNGDAISAVRAHRAAENEGSNRVYAEFEITPTAETEQGFYVSNESYKGKIGVSYRFIPNSSSSYVGMAAVARELLVRNGSLTSDEVQDEGEYPFNLSLIGEADGRICTDFSGAYDIAAALSSKGINNINLRYRGVLEDNRIRDSLDKDNSYEEFIGFVSSKGIKLFADADILETGKDGNKALTLSGEESVMNNKSLRGAEGISEAMNSLLYSTLSGDFTGICFNGAGEFIYSDFTKGEVVLKGDMRDVLFEQINSASATKEIMVSRGNLYSLKYADVIVDLDDGCFYGEARAAQEIPFVQAVLHGTVEYSHSAINTAEDCTAAFLKCVEYGAVPYYEWHSDVADPESNGYYLNSTAQAKQQYDAAKAVFENLRDKKITAHSTVAENVYLTVYGDQTEIYVNYGEEAVTVSGVTIEARSFIRVN